MQKFFLYARKSTDVEDKQVLSIEAQLQELRDFAKRENIEIVCEFVEKQSAKIPGRPIFNNMISQIEKGFANGILAWHPDRLARNSVDGGRIIYLVDEKKLEFLKFPSFGLNLLHKANLCSPSPLVKANTMWILFPKIPNAVCDKNSARRISRTFTCGIYE
jgi:hypothetical protein